VRKNIGRSPNTSMYSMYIGYLGDSTALLVSHIIPPIFNTRLRPKYPSKVTRRLRASDEKVTGKCLELKAQ